MPKVKWAGPDPTSSLC